MLALGLAAAMTSLSVFAYDSKAPLDIQERAAEDVAGVRVTDLTYASPKGGRVPAYLLVPGGKGPFAGIVFMHWGEGDRNEFLSEGMAFAKRGAVAIMIDAPYRRSGPPTAPK